MPTYQEALLELLQFEAYFKTVQVIYNSIWNRDLNTAAKIITTTTKYLCLTIGNLSPDCEKLYFYSKSLDALREAVKGSLFFKKRGVQCLNQVLYKYQIRTLDDIMYEDGCRRYALAFDGQRSYGVFYTYLKLKEQEIRIIIWLAEMISRRLAKNHPGWKTIFIPFSHLGK
ncbi:unnamed protein product (macronuclear) [Paramecium tetraurelia]|uniref:Uncharacterized protein n=1 Tax=Paramecium tetraurelia TaxID=5888 RepID=A0C552_PARTE|nr:uncharacterized protein GSPATT00006418001 [Paramecium tetraurelia]CAK65919.1 unnamed protein product [Paramecium tetraurelia]|eukprot:XP_001433316.1 hypothetical protein (macronuclear) [Paramecium tetraurelia strain d4-2]